MDCASARRAMLEADPAELTAGAASELGRHLEGCAACRLAALEILSLERGLADWLSGARSRIEAADALAQAAASARRRTAFRRLGAVGSLLAAAALAGLLLLPRPDTPGGGTPAARAPSVAAGFSVTSPPGRDLVVLHTANPKIVVVWYLPSRRSS